MSHHLVHQFVVIKYYAVAVVIGDRNIAVNRWMVDAGYPGGNIETKAPARAGLPEEFDGVDP